MDKMYVQQYGQLENSHWWFIIRKKIILNTLRKFIGAGKSGSLKVLNAGAATGSSSRWLSEFGEVISLENDPFFLSHLAAQDLAVIKGSVTDIPMGDDSVDLVCALDIIEHVEDDRKAVEELLRVCKPGGSVLITVPAFQSIWGNHDIINGHQRRYRRRQLQNLVAGHTASILYATYFNSILFVPVFLFRKIQLLFKGKRGQTDSDFSFLKSNDFVNRLFKTIFGAELYLLKAMRFPFGVSLMMLIRKDPFPAENLQKEKANTSQGK